MLRPLLLVLVAASTARADIDPARLGRIDAAVEAAVARKEIPGAVVVVVHDDAVVFRKAFGNFYVEPPTKMRPEVVFDLASLTKPIATATSVFALVEQGKLHLSDPVAKHWPAFAANGKDRVTIEHCLLHTAGLTPDNAIADYAEGREKALANVAALKLEAPAGTRFKYSDVGFITLGVVVEKVSGKPLDKFAAETVFEPLKLTHTAYSFADIGLPFAPTGMRKGENIRGEVHDPRAFALGGVAGHAGLFSTADDVARFARMLLRGGELDGVRVLSPLAVKWLTEPVPVPGGGLRSRGWDVDTSYSSPRGDLFPPGDGFGHTGFTGTSLWVDPPSKTAIVILTNRLHPDEKKGNATPVRKAVGNIVASAITSVRAGSVCDGLRSSVRAGSVSDGLRLRFKSFADASGSVSVVGTGIDVLRAEKFARLAGRRVGLVTNHTGRAADGTPTIDLLAAAPNVKLVALFSPEHGIRGEKDEKVGDGTDAKTGRPVFSLYGDRRKPTADTLKGIDTLVYDIQDIGCRFYTYSSTLGLILEAGAEHKVRVVVLDRPNPVDGVTVEGPVRDAGRESFVAYHTLPLRHGLTVGEMATLFNAERKVGAELDVVKLTGWRRADTYDRTGLPWVNPSPNMRHLTAALVYPGVGLIETTNVSVGRGTERPFEWVGAPWIDGRKLAAAMSAKNLPGVRFVPVSRTPEASKFKGEVCGGIDIIVDDWATVRPVSLGLTLASVLHELYPQAWETKNFDRLLVHKATFDAILAGKSPASAEAAWKAGLDTFRVRREAALLYRD